MCKYILIAGCIMMILFSGCKNGRCPKAFIVAHRGASGVAPENTLAAAVLAFEEGADATEIDVHLTKDRRIVVMHDKSTKRTCGVEMIIAETDSSALACLDAGSLKSEVYAGEKIPFIEEIIEVLPCGKKLFIEVKCSAEIAPYLNDVIVSGGKIEQMVIISFDADVLVEAKKVMPQVPVYWLKSTDKDKQTGRYLPHDASIISFASDKGFDGVDLHYAGITKAFVDKARKSGIEVHTWTVDDVDDARRMAACGVRSITTNYPDVIRQALESESE